jgi:glucose-1-phosphate thymidylyltransferase
MVACLEEIAFAQGFISAEQLEKQAQTMQKSSYGAYLMGLIRQT